MHQHLAHPPGPDPHPPSMIDNISDSLLNAFKTVRKPDERFVGMREGLERFEEGLIGVERVWGRGRARTGGESMILPIMRDEERIQEDGLDGLTDR